MKVCSIFSQVLKLFSRGGGLEKAVGETTRKRRRAGLHQLGPVHCHVVLPGGTGAFLARDLRGSGVLRRPLEAFGSAGGAQEVDLGLRQ